jgi:hypothetical protein
MIEFLPESTGNVVGILASGRLTDADYKQVLIPRLEAVFAEHGKLKLLVHMAPSFEGWDLSAAWEDVTYGLRHRADFEKVAIVGGPTWVALSVQLGGFLMKGEIKIFPAGDLDSSWAWVTS